MNKIDDILTEQIERHKTPSAQYYFFNQDTILKTFQKGYAVVAVDIIVKLEFILILKKEV